MLQKETTNHTSVHSTWALGSAGTRTTGPVMVLSLEEILDDALETDGLNPSSERRQNVRAMNQATATAVKPSLTGPVTHWCYPACEELGRASQPRAKTQSIARGLR